MKMCDTDKKKMKPATLPRGQRPALPPKPQFPLIEGLKVKDICHTGDAVSECHGNSSVIEPSRNLTSTIAEPTIALHDTQITKVPPKPPVKPRRTCEKREKIQARLSYGSVEDCNHTHDETSADTLNENSDAWKNDSTPSSWFIQKIHRQTLDKDECKKTDSTSHSSLIRPSPTPRSFYNKPNAEDHNTGSSHDVVGKPEKTDATVPAKPARKGKKHKHGKKDTESGGSVVVIQKVEEGHVAVLGVLPLNSPEEDVENDSKNNSKTEVIESRKKSTPPRPPPPSIGPKPKPRLSLNKKEVQNVAKEGQEKKTGVALKPIEEKQDQDKKTGVALKSIKASTDQQVRSIESLKSDEEKESKEVKDFDHLESDKEKEQSEQTVHLKVADPKSGRKMGESEIKKKSTKKAPPTPSRSDSLTKYIENKVKSGDITAVHSKKEELSSSHKEDVSDQPSGRVRPARPAPPVLPKLKSPITSDRRNSNELKPAKVKPPRPAPPRPPSMKVSVREHSIETTTDSKIVVSTQSEDKTEQPTMPSKLVSTRVALFEAKLQQDTYNYECIRQHSDQDENDSSVVDHEFDESSSDDEQDSGPEDDEPISEDEKKKK
uniref:DNA ligase 1-like n=1 Tax=Saccoglossus kowalevskii TaxID=10224 RepID=A0ABM0GWR4_SACKO|nr:PREDICTED: DNA ligase 1-like [Saccoglossus kowalevskii]